MNPNQAPESIEQKAVESVPPSIPLSMTTENIEFRIKTARFILESLFRDIRELNPIVNEHGKYLNIDLTVHGYGDGEAELSFYFGSQLRIGGVKTFSQISDAIREYDPEAIKAKRISELQTELAKLTAETKSEGAD